MSSVILSRSTTISSPASTNLASTTSKSSARTIVSKSPSTSSASTFRRQCDYECEYIRQLDSDNDILNHCASSTALVQAWKCKICMQEDPTVHKAEQLCDWTINGGWATQHIPVPTPSAIPTPSIAAAKPSIVVRPDEPVSSGGISTNVKIAVGVSVAVVPILILLGVVFWYHRIRRRGGTSPSKDAEKTGSAAGHYESDVDRDGDGQTQAPVSQRTKKVKEPKPEDQDLAAALRAVAEHENRHRRTGSTPRSSMDKRLPDRNDVYVVHMFVEEEGRSSAVVSCEAHSPHPGNVRTLLPAAPAATTVPRPRGNTVPMAGAHIKAKSMDSGNHLAPPPAYVKGHRPRLSLQTTNLGGQRPVRR